MEDEILNKLEQAQSKLESALSKLTPQQLQLILSDDDLYNELLDQVGLNQVLQDYADNFDKIAFAELSKYSKVDAIARDIERIDDNLSLIKASHERTVLGYYKFQTEFLRQQLTQSFINGQTSKDTIKALAQNTPLTTAQAGAVIGTSYADFSRSTIAEAFDGDQDQRFAYEGSRDKRNSDQCAYLLDNQNPEGYTKAEIDKGIKTPFGVINWFGREPNFNCRHEWRPIIET